MVFDAGRRVAAAQEVRAAVVGDMLTATALAIFFVPLFVVLVFRLFWVKPRRSSSNQALPFSTPVRMLEPAHLP
jgi:hypothetical protein